MKKSRGTPLWLDLLLLLAWLFWGMWFVVGERIASLRSRRQKRGRAGDDDAREAEATGRLAFERSPPTYPARPRSEVVVNEG